MPSSISTSQRVSRSNRRWQIILSFLSSAGAIPPSNTIAIQDIKLGIPVILLCLEMFLFSILHLWAYPWRDYDASRGAVHATAESGAGDPLDPATAYHGGPFGWRALWDAFNLWDVAKAIGRGFRWVCVGRRKRVQDVSYDKWRKAAAGGSSSDGAVGGLGRDGYTSVDIPLQETRPGGLREQKSSSRGGGKSGGKYVPLGGADGDGVERNDGVYDGKAHGGPPPMYGGSAEMDTTYHGAAAGTAPPRMGAGPPGAGRPGAQTYD